MSWWSDGNPFNEHEGCKKCNFNKHPTKETCQDCKTGDKWNYKDWDEEEIETDCPWK